jgi:uncharacterized membrane protein YoaK (UPF0700 family)
MSETFPAAALLSASGGLQDAYTYIVRGGVFANAQTGNVVLLSQSLLAGEIHRAVGYIVPLLSFAFGVAAAEFIRLRYKNARTVHWRQLVLLCEIVLLLLVGFAPQSMNLLANAAVSLSCAMQVQAFRHVGGNAYASTMCIGNLRSGVESLCTYATGGDKGALKKACTYFGVIAFFALGAGAGCLFIPIMGIKTVWLSCTLLLIGFALMLSGAKRNL